VTIVIHDAELALAALGGDTLGPAGYAEFDVIVFDADGWNEGDPGFVSLELAIAAAEQWLAADDDWVRAEVRTTKVPDGDWPVLVTVTR
jgi:hypothetical protein